MVGPGRWVPPLPHGIINDEGDEGNCSRPEQLSPMVTLVTPRKDSHILEWVKGWVTTSGWGLVLRRGK